MIFITVSFHYVISSHITSLIGEVPGAVPGKIMSNQLTHFINFIHELTLPATDTQGKSPPTLYICGFSTTPSLHYVSPLPCYPSVHDQFYPTPLKSLQSKNSSIENMIIMLHDRYSLYNTLKML